MPKFLKKHHLLLFGLIFVLVFFYKFILLGLLPIPTDTIAGIYHPFRDLYASEYPNGIPFENSQVTDPIRQQYPWRELSVSSLANLEIPLWNQYNFAGYPLLANFQSAAFFPGNLIFLFLPFSVGWSILILAQSLLAYIFMFLYMRNLKVSELSAFISSAAFSFSGFFISWLEWGNVAMTGLWLPLVLLSIDRIFTSNKNKIWEFNKWSAVFLISFVCAFLAGHLQVFYYLLVVSILYFLLRWFEFGKKINLIVNFFLLSLAFLIITAFQWIPTLKLISLSARSIDQVSTTIEGWFVPWQNLTQFIAPDFFGNPATLNYWGVWNYGEFIGYIGILPIIFAIGAILFRRDKNTIFFALLLFISIIFAFPSIISNIPFKFSFPLISTSQPTRLIYLIDFALVVLAGFGFDYFQKQKKRILFPAAFIATAIAAMWGFVLFNKYLPQALNVTEQNLSVTLSNLKLPTIIFIATIFLILIFIFINKKIKGVNIGKIALGLAIMVFLFDIFRFADKYTVFAENKYLYPSTKATEFLVNQDEKFRIMANDSRILPPNFTSIYRLESIDGYDPLYTLRYAELMAAIGRNEENINPPFGFNRIITLQNYHSSVIDILNIKYVLAFGDIQHENFIKVFKEGETSIYENVNFIDRAFFVRNTVSSTGKYDAIKKIFDNKTLLGEISIVESPGFDKEWSVGEAKISKYSPNQIEIKTENDADGFLVLTDSYYPTWKVSIDGVVAEIFLTDYNFRGVVVPKGKHTVVFTNSLF